MEPSRVTDQYIVETLWRRWGITPRKIGKEYHAPCPMCGGHKRAWVSQQGYFHCRECDWGDWLDSDKPFEIDPVKLAELREKEARRELERQKDIERRIRELRTQDVHSAYRQGRDDEAMWIAKEYFNSQGINDHLIQYYELGYVSEHLVKTDSEIIHLPAYTIPVRDPLTWELVNVQYRLVDPPDGVGKYRQATGIPAASFFAEPMEKIEGKAIVCEGAKKAIVTYDRIEARTQVVGLPGCSPSKLLLEQLKGFDAIWLILDPGCNKQAEKIKGFLPQTRIVDIPNKVDDAWLAGMTESEFKSYLLQARR